MNTQTGEILDLQQRDLQNEAIIQMIENGNLLPVDIEKATEKQRSEMQVSKYDNISFLGKMFTGNRKDRRKQAKVLLKKQLNVKSNERK